MVADLPMPLDQVERAWREPAGPGQRVVLTPARP